MPLAAALRFALFTLVPILALSACSSPREESFTEQVRRAAIEEARTGPGLWRLADEDTTVYLFGTVHILRPGTDWQFDTVRNAIKASDTIYFEADIDSPRARRDLNQTVTELGYFLDGRTLQMLLDDEAEREVKQTARLLGQSIAEFDHMKPWLASFSLSNEHEAQLGFEPSSGVESVLQLQALQLGKPVRYLETGAEQISIIAQVPEDEQIDLLVQTAEQIEDEPDFLDEMIAEWVEGDAEALGEMIANDNAFGSGQLYDLLLKQRNANWTGQIKTLMEDEPGTFFIAVGAGHLAGADSLQAMLSADGYTVHRENPRKLVPEPG